MSQLDSSSSTGFLATGENELFPIREVAHQTGVNPVTLRAWERRYGLIKPLRTAKGHRIYSLKHINKIHTVLAWLERGVAVACSQNKRLRRVIQIQLGIPRKINGYSG